MLTAQAASLHSLLSLRSSFHSLIPSADVSVSTSPPTFLLRCCRTPQPWQNPLYESISIILRSYDKFFSLFLLYFHVSSHSVFFFFYKNLYILFFLFILFLAYTSLFLFLQYCYIFVHHFLKSISTSHHGYGSNF